MWVKKRNREGEREREYFLLRDERLSPESSPFFCCPALTGISRCGKMNFCLTFFEKSLFLKKLKLFQKFQRVTGLPDQ